ncbi:MAG: signal peptidase II [Myxococcales bacterium]|nr:signal peptidase II [Myxococcales bacterium]
MVNPLLHPRLTSPENQVRLISLLSVALSAALLDQITKWVAEAALPADGAVSLWAGVLSLRLRANPHGAFGLFSSLPEPARLPLMLGLSALALLLAFWVTLRVLGLRPLVAVALGLILGGAAANLADRLVRREVIDFVELFNGHWPTFNLADVAITAGCLLLVAVLVRRGPGGRPDPTLESDKGGLA